MIKVMDKVRSAEVVNAFDVETVILFPNISIGDAEIASEQAPVEGEQAVEADEQASSQQSPSDKE